MLELHDIFMMLNAGVSVLAFAVTYVAWRRRAARGAVWIAVTMLGVAIWSGAAAVMWSVSTIGGQVFWLKATFFGVSMVPVGWLMLTLVIARMERWHSLRIVASLFSMAAAMLVIRLLNPGEMYDVAFTARPMGSFTHYQPVPGPLYDAYNVFAFSVVGIGLLVLVRVALRSHGPERLQAGILLIGASMPFIASAVTESRVVPLAGLDLAPIGFLGTGALWLVAVLGGSLLEVVPVARRVLVDQMSDGVVVLDERERVLDANPAALVLLRAHLDETLGKSFGVLLGGVAHADALLGDGPRRALLSMGSDDDSRCVDVRSTPLEVGHGPPARLVTLHDVTEEQRAQEGLVLARTVFETANEGIVVVQPGSEERIIDVNEAATRMTGRSREDSVGMSLGDFRSDRHPPEFYEEIQRTVYSAGKWQGEVWQVRADGTSFPSWLSLSVATDDQGQARHVVGVFTDITEINQHADEKLEHQLTHDALTGLPNRYMVEDRLGHALAHARRVGDRLAVVAIGLDAFKDINDALGQTRGDALLIEVARRLDPLVRESDMVARTGGDEFTIILTGVKDPAEVGAAVRRLLDVLEAPYIVGEEELHLTSSAGVALFSAGGTEATTLIQQADLAMHRAKGMGRGTIQFFAEGFREGVERRMAIERELWDADKQGRYSLLYQPQIDLSTGQVVGVEALVRLRGRDGVALLPDEFIPVAEDSELILQLGAWVLDRACHDLVALHKDFPELTMSVNFSARQFVEADMGALRNVLRTCGMDPQFLVIEVTETALLRDPQEAATRLEEFRAVKGLQLSLDDFGTGYSSLTYARLMHPDAIKIDRSFVELLPDDSKARAIVLSTIELAKSLDAHSVAEGPETEEQVRFLRANGCDQAQGYYFSRPISLDELTVLLRNGAFPLPEVAVAGAKRV